MVKTCPLGEKVGGSLSLTELRTGLCLQSIVDKPNPLGGPQMLYLARCRSLGRLLLGHTHTRIRRIHTFA